TTGHILWCGRPRGCIGEQDACAVCSEPGGLELPGHRGGERLLHEEPGHVVVVHVDVGVAEHRWAAVVRADLRREVHHRHLGVPAAVGGGEIGQRRGGVLGGVLVLEVGAAGIVYLRRGALVFYHRLGARSWYHLTARAIV